MHYYKRNLGDYAKKAGRLSMLQHGAYTLLIDACYDREQFPTRDDAIEWTWASSAAEIEAVEFVLRKFFVLEGEIYIQKRIQEEIDLYHAKSEKNARIATGRHAKRTENDAKRTPIASETSPQKCESLPNQEPLTKNQEPNKSNSYTSVPDVVDASGDRRPACPHREIIAAYHELLPACPRVLPELWSGAREVALRTRWNEKPERQNLDWWRDFFRYIGYSSFLTGRAPTSGDRKPFVATLDWIVKPSNFVKIYEGRYLNPNEAAAYERDHGDDNES